ncbi:MAG: type IX secretion system protein PorQ [Balneolaceae bacterium]
MKQLLIFPLIFFIATALHARQQQDTVFRFLTLSPDARTAGLGGSHAALLSPGASAFSINPALLNSSDPGIIQLSYLNHIGDIRFGTANYAADTPVIGGKVAASLRYLGYGGMTRYDETGRADGSLSSGDLAITLGYAAPIENQLSYGLSVTGIHSNIAGYRSSGISVSGGLLYEFASSETAIGAYLQNAGTQLSTYNGSAEPLPLNIAAGVVHRLQYIPVRLHLTFQRLNTWNQRVTGETEEPDFLSNLSRHLVGGAELLFGERVQLRLGYDSWLGDQTQTGKRIDGAGLSVGVGLQLNNIDVDFSRTSFSDMGSVVQLGVAFSI